ncbi:MAG: PA-phosphatase [Devosia sp. SCN 66-27]|mgnify:CR=1 FL=1|nr:MAG: PA-phosphatase [Devosia sp. SCN 66-27]
MRMLRNRLEPRILAAIVAAATAAWIFVEVAEKVVEGETRAIDTAILLLLRAPADPAPPGSKWLEEVARDITGLGSPVVLGLIIMATAVFFRLADRGRVALFVIAATVSGAVTSTLLKEFFSRPRPDLVPHGAYVYTASFPSGHAMMAAVVYLTLGALIARVASERKLKLYIMAVATLLAGLVGVSRVYLGVHWPTDVLAGWAAGAAWALACWGVAQLLDLGTPP